MSEDAAPAQAAAGAVPAASEVAVAAPAVPAESAWARRVRAVAVLVFAVTLFLPVHACTRGELASAPLPRGMRYPPPPWRVQVPLPQLYDQLSLGAMTGTVDAVWNARMGYPYLLVPFWVVALALCATGARGARVAGVLTFVLTAAVLALEIPYVLRDFGGILPVSLRPVEVAIAWAVVAAILLLRRGGRSLFDAEAAISAQALLCALHGFTFLANDLRVWVHAGAAPGAMVRAALSNYLPAFWVAEAALFVAAAPSYLPRRRLAGAVPAAVLTRGPA